MRHEVRIWWPGGGACAATFLKPLAGVKFMPQRYGNYDHQNMGNHQYSMYFTIGKSDVSLQYVIVDLEE